MKWQAVVFDLFGTLVPPFRKAEHTLAIGECAQILGVDFEDCHRLWVESFPRRAEGGFASIAENFQWIAQQSATEVADEAFDRAARSYGRFTSSGLEPFDGVMDTLGRIGDCGLRLGLLTNCAPDVPEILAQTPLGRCFDASVFSCRVKAVKPAREVYELVLQRIGTDPARTLYVGDGSDGELAGAAAAGLCPLLVTPSLVNTYDAHRPEVEGWTGDRIAAIPDVLRYLEQR